MEFPARISGARTPEPALFLIEQRQKMRQNRIQQSSIISGGKPWQTAFIPGLSRENRIMSIVLSSHTTETILSLVPAGQHLALPMSVLKAQNSHSKAY